MEEEDIQARRRARLAAWLDSRGGAASVVVAFGLKASDESYLSQLRGGYSFGERSARNWERRLRLPAGYFDREEAEKVDAGAPESLDERTVTPKVLAWESLMQADLDEEFQTTMPDASMAPDIPRGARIIFLTGIAPEPPDFVLLTDRDGHLYVREYRQLQPGRWEAHATNPGYLPLDSAIHGLRILAVYDGIRGRRSQRM